MSTTPIVAEELLGDGHIAVSSSLRARVFAKPVGVASIVVLLVVIGVAIFAPILLPHVDSQAAGNILHVNEGPSRAHLLGTDTVGRDVLDRLLVGTRATIIAAGEFVLTCALLALPMGLAAGYLGGRFDRAAGWITDLSLAMPGLIIILVVLTVIPRSTTAAMITLGILSAPALARIVRAATLPIREELYIAAARVSGLSRPYIITRHILPRITGVVIVQLSLYAAAGVLIQAGLSFLGVIGSLTAPTWGGMTADGFHVLQQQPWLLWPPGIAIGLTVLALTTFGDALRDSATEAWSQPHPHRKRTRSLAQPTGYLTQTSETLLAVAGLTVSFPSSTGSTRVLEDVTFDVGAGETVGIVGESGCGKTMTAMAILNLLPGEAEIEAGSIAFEGKDLAVLSEREMRRLRGTRIAFISQEPTSSLTPTYRVGFQIAQLVRLHHRVSRKAATARALELLQQVRLPDPPTVARRYPHELSGGMAQRVALARALAGEPSLLIADEPTTALDVTIQAEILDVLRDLAHERRMALLLVTHDWGVVADLCNRAIVMYAGQLVESADLDSIFRLPLHPYTEALLASSPHHAPSSDRLPTIPGSVPSPWSWPHGCHFYPRCRYATKECSEQPIPLIAITKGRQTRCIYHERLAQQAVTPASPPSANKTARLSNEGTP